MQATRRVTLHMLEGKNTLVRKESGWLRGHPSYGQNATATCKLGFGRACLFEYAATNPRAYYALASARPRCQFCNGFGRSSVLSRVRHVSYRCISPSRGCQFDQLSTHTQHISHSCEGRHRCATYLLYFDRIVSCISGRRRQEQARWKEHSVLNRNKGLRVDALRLGLHEHSQYPLPSNRYLALFLGAFFAIFRLPRGFVP